MYFIGNFVHATNQEQTEEAERRHGEFSLIIDADDPYQALQKFKDRVVRYREGSQFFQGDCSVFLVQLFEFDRFPVDDALMLNYKSVAGDPLMPFIRCSFPNELTETCRVFDWQNETPQIDGQNEKLFLKFKAGSSTLLNEPDASFGLSPQS